ncbi:MAG: L-lysine exporter family protein LysE/ArgO [Clostridiales bacterium]|nr:L-lysine exporter family protein LysE/ArgO [Clostridiales bacterium]
MFTYLIQGFVLGLAYLAPIGAQNLYVINSAISMNRIRAYQVAFITTIFDISLALASFYGIGVLIDKFYIIKILVFFFGSIAVIYVGFNLIKSQPDLSKKVDVDKPILQIVSICFAVTWLNPQALIDGSLLLGGFRASLSLEASKVFITGVCLASFTWFTGLATIAWSFRSVLNSTIVRIINVVCGIVVIYYGLKLGYNFIQVLA